MKTHFPEIVAWVMQSNWFTDGGTRNIRLMTLRWCASRGIVINRHQLETVELNLYPHITEAKRLGLASDPPLASQPQNVQCSPARTCYSPVPSSIDFGASCDKENVAPIFSRVQSEGVRLCEIELSDDDFV